MMAALDSLKKLYSAPVTMGGASLALSLGGAWTAGGVYDAIVRARPAWALWIPEAPILNRPEVQLIVIIPLLAVLVTALVVGIWGRRAFVSKLAVAISVLAILQSAAMAAQDIRHMVVLSQWAHLYYAARQEPAVRPLTVRHTIIAPKEAR